MVRTSNLRFQLKRKDFQTRWVVNSSFDNSFAVMKLRWNTALKWNATTKFHQIRNLEQQSKYFTSSVLAVFVILSQEPLQENIKLPNTKAQEQFTKIKPDSIWCKTIILSPHSTPRLTILKSLLRKLLTPVI